MADDGSRFRAFASRIFRREACAAFRREPAGTLISSYAIFSQQADSLRQIRFHAFRHIFNEDTPISRRAECIFRLPMLSLAEYLSALCHDR